MAPARNGGGGGGAWRRGWAPSDLAPVPAARPRASPPARTAPCARARRPAPGAAAVALDRRDRDHDPLGRVPPVPGRRAVLVAAQQLARDLRPGRPPPGGAAPAPRPIPGSRAAPATSDWSETGPWPGTTTSGSSSRIRSSAAIQPAVGPAHITGATSDEQDVRGEHDARIRHVDDQVPGGVRRADLDQPHLAPADVERQLAAELARRRGDAHAGEVVRRQHPADVLAERSQRQAREAGKGEAADHGQGKAAHRAQDGRELLEPLQRAGRLLADQMRRRRWSRRCRRRAAS